MANRNKVAMVVEAIAELAPLRRTRPVTRQDIKEWVGSHYGVELDDRWLDLLLKEHVAALKRYIERQKALKDATTQELVELMLDDIEEAMRRHQIEAN